MPRQDLTPAGATSNHTMNKLFLFIAFIAVAIGIAFAQEYKNRVPRPDEAAWTAGVFDFNWNTNGSQSNTYRSARIQVPTNTASVIISNASITTNAIIMAFSEMSTNTNFVRVVAISNAGFTIWLNGTNELADNMGVRYFIQRY